MAAEDWIPSYDPYDYDANYGFFQDKPKPRRHVPQFKLWKSGNKYMKPRDMTYFHIQNCIAILEKEDNEWARRWIAIFENELENR